MPQWAYMPLSGEGAARFGGRWNPVGVPTLYAAREMSTAWAEYNQGFVQHPALIAQMRLTRARLCDLTDPAMLRELDTDPAIHADNWRDRADRGEVPPAHVLRERLLEEGYDGVVYPSVISPGGHCVALWRWNEASGPLLEIIDPDRRMPTSPASWL